MIRLSDNEEQQAQLIACSHLVRGCEGAVSEHGLATGEIEGQSPTMERAQDILAQVLFSWQDTLKVLRTAEEPGAVTTVVSNLAGWTSDELLAEVLERRAEDVPALRLMQGVLLRALLTAHDRDLATDHLAS